MDKKTTLNWIGQVVEPDMGSGDTPPSHSLNRGIIVKLAHKNESRWRNSPPYGAVLLLCDMDVLTKDTLGDKYQDRAGKKVFLKLQLSNTVIKKHLAALIRMFDKEPDALDMKHWEEDCSILAEDEQADLVNGLRLRRRQFTDDLEREQEVIYHPFVRSISDGL